MDGRADRAAGVLLGLAAGDRIGGPVRMALRVAESVRDRCGVNLSDIEMRYLAWWREGAFDTGPTVARVLFLVMNGVPIDRAAMRVDESSCGMTAGCNPAHRSSPLAMCASLDDSELDRAAVAEARLTHRHPVAGEVAAVVVRLCRALIRGSSWSVAIETAGKGRSQEICRVLEGRHDGGLSRSGFAPEVLRSAVHFLDQSDSLPTALVRATDFAGPANYCPVLVGSIGGARWGRSDLDEALLRHHGDLVPRLKAVALDLARGWRNGIA